MTISIMSHLFKIGLLYLDNNQHNSALLFSLSNKYIFIFNKIPLKQSDMLRILRICTKL